MTDVILRLACFVRLFADAVCIYSLRKKEIVSVNVDGAPRRSQRPV